MSRLIDWLLNRIPLVRKLNGHKTKIGLVLYALSLVADLLFKSEVLFPDLAGSGTALSNFIQQIISLLENLGISGMAIGGAGKIAKEQVAKKEAQV
jgi:hypothetical protein